MASTTPARVRNVLGVSADDYSDSDIEHQIIAAEEFVGERLGGVMTSEELLTEITTLVAADLVFPRVSGEANGQQIAEIDEGEARIRYVASFADVAIGNSTHWQHAIRLDPTGRLGQKSVGFGVR